MSPIEGNLHHKAPTLAELFVRAIKRYGNHTALVDSRERITYEELGRRIGKYAAAFRASGLRRGDGLVQLASNRVDAVAVIGAAFLCGLRYTPLNGRGSLQDQLFIIEDIQASAIVIDEEAFADRIQSLSNAIGVKGRVFSFNPSEFAVDLRLSESSEEVRLLTWDSDSEDIAFIIYTGGTTGRPKGVVHKHRSLVTNILIELAEFDWPDEIRFLAATPISHAAFAFILPVLLRGGVYVLEDKFSPKRFAEIISREKITATFLVPSMINTLLQAAEIEDFDLSSLEMMVYGAAPMPTARMIEAINRFGPIFVQLYGQAEAPNVISILGKQDHCVDRPERLVSCGVPTVGTIVKLLDDDGIEVPQGSIGEICVRGPLVMEEYWNRPAETAAALFDGWLHTGDLARIDCEGYLTIIDRKKDMIISGGFNVYPREVEEALVTHPAVLNACVFGIPDSKWGEAVKAVVVIRKGQTVEPEELISWVKAHKGPVNTPKSIDIVKEIPLTAVGKPDRKFLREPYWRGRDRSII